MSYFYYPYLWFSRVFIVPFFAYSEGLFGDVGVSEIRVPKEGEEEVQIENEAGGNLVLLVGVCKGHHAERVSAGPQRSKNE